MLNVSPVSRGQTPHWDFSRKCENVVLGFSIQRVILVVVIACIRMCSLDCNTALLMSTASVNVNVQQSVEKTRPVPLASRTAAPAFTGVYWNCMWLFIKCLRVLHRWIKHNNEFPSGDYGNGNVISIECRVEIFGVCHERGSRWGCCSVKVNASAMLINDSSSRPSRALWWLNASLPAEITSKPWTRNTFVIIMHCSWC